VVLLLAAAPTQIANPLEDLEEAAKHLGLRVLTF
jgi:hypothetical protein